VTDVLVLFAAGCATALATGLGAIPVFALGQRAARLRPALTGVAIGLMGVASVVGLLLPALGEGSALSVALGLTAGVAFLALTRARLRSGEPHVTALRTRSGRTAALTFAVLLVHSLPEGLAIGTAYASSTEGLGLFVILAIALQNVPEGTSVAIPMEAAGYGRAAQFWGAVATSAPQPVGAVVAFLLVETVAALLPFSFAFAAGAMLALIVAELIPAAFGRERWLMALSGALFGAGLMLALSALLGV
jgi:ZIP family zinc transporter